MANEYFVNSADLTAIADAIRTKGETTERLVFPGGFVSAIGDISTGVELNFEVVGGTSQPSSPMPNTIWVNTDVPITGWYFGVEDISGQIDVSNAVNATNVVSGFSNGVISFRGDISPAWSSTYIAKLRLVEGVKYVLSANIGYGRFSISKHPDSYPDGVIDFVERLNCGSILNCGTQSVEITPIETADYYMNYCSDQADANGTKPSFSTGIYLYPKDVNIWIRTSATSNVAFNALKGNGIFVYPNSAKQYVSGAWVDKTVKIYRSGVWVDLLTYIYSYGDQYTELTGGWKAVYPNGYASNAQDTSNGLYMKKTSNTGSYVSNWYTKNKIDVTNFKTLYARFVGSVANADGNEQLLRIGLHSNNTDTENQFSGNSFNDYTTANKEQLISYNVSSFTGSYYVKLNHQGGGGADIRWKEVWFE